MGSDMCIRVSSEVLVVSELYYGMSRIGYCFVAKDLAEALLALAVRICLEAGVDGLRPDITIYRAACALAALDGRKRVVEDDVYRAALLALGHRRRPHPLDTPPSSRRSLDELIERKRFDSRAAALHELDQAARLAGIEEIELHQRAERGARAGDGAPAPPARRTGERRCRQ